MSKKEITVETPTDKEEVATVVAEPVKLTNEASQLYGTPSLVVQSHLSAVEAYIKAMAPGMMIDDGTGTLWTERLYNAMYSIVTLPKVADMVDGMDGLLVLFNRESKGALYTTYTQRFTYKWNTDEQTRNLFSNLCYIFYTFAVPDQRKSMGKYINLTGENNLLKALPAEASQRLSSYLRRLLD